MPDMMNTTRRTLHRLYVLSGHHRHEQPDERDTVRAQTEQLHEGAVHTVAGTLHVDHVHVLYSDQFYRSYRQTPVTLCRTFATSQGADMDSKNRQAHATEPSQVSRRSVAKGTAWAVPAITSMTLVPAFAASAQRKQVIITFDAKKHKETIQCVRIPAEATDIRYSIRGGAGGAGPKDSWGERGGSGAEVLGQIHRPGEGTAAAQEFTIWGVAGGYGPTAAWNDNAVEFATGYGNGGPSMGVPYHTSTVSTEQWSERWCHGGGAGSAIAIGGDPEGPGQLVAVAGGGGAAGTGTYSREAANMGPNV